MKKTLVFLMAVLFVGMLSSCGGGDKLKLPENAALLMDKYWRPDVNANIKSTTDAAEEATGISANFELKDDVKKIGDFLAGKYRFTKDAKDKTRLVYEVVIGEGFFSGQSEVGKWEISEDGKFVSLYRYDSDEGAYAETPEKYEIVELTESKLVWKKEGSDVISTYTTE